MFFSSSISMFFKSKELTLLSFTSPFNLEVIILNISSLSTKKLLVPAFIVISTPEHFFESLIRIPAASKTIVPVPNTVQKMASKIFIIIFFFTIQSTL